MTEIGASSFARRSARFARIRAQVFAEREAALMAALPGVTVGYIGNLTGDLDDRSWSIFLPHPGREGAPEDRIGDLPTDRRFELIPLMNAMIRAAEIAQASGQ